MQTKRNLGVDTLRIVLMLFGIIRHLYDHTGVRNKVPFLSGKLVFTWATLSK